MDHRRVHEVVHSLRAKPQHVRERIALGAAGGVTLVVALGWFAASAATGAFSLAPTTVANANVPDLSKTVSQGSSNFGNLLGAAGAAFGATTTPAQITVIDASTTPAPQNENDTNQTVIHF